MRSWFLSPHIQQAQRKTVVLFDSQLTVGNCWFLFFFGGDIF